MKQHPKSGNHPLRALPVATLIAAGITAPMLFNGAPDLNPPPPPSIAPPAALLSGPVEVSVAAAEPGAEIYTTSDGSVPGRDAGARYDAPLTIDTTTVIRAASVRPWIADSPAATASYLFPAQTAWQPAEPAGFPMNWHGNHLEEAPDGPIPADYAMDPRAVPDRDKYAATMEKALRSLPTISLAVDPDGLFDLETGIYPNSTQRGAAWERPVSIEMFERDGTLAFQADAGIRVHGALGRKLHVNPKLGFRILFRREYGRGKLHYPVFGDSNQTSFDALLLRNMTQDTWVAQGIMGFEAPHYIRDAFARETQRAMGHPAIRGRFVHLYLNGLYWGIYTLSERVDGAFLSARFGGGELDYDIIKGQLADLGTREAWDRVEALAGHRNDPSANAALESLLDLDSFIDFVLINHFIDNTDWFFGNALAVRKRDPDGKFIFLVYDAEATFGAHEFHFDYLDTAVLVRRYTSSFTPMHLFHQIRLEPEFRVRIADRIQRHYFNGGALTVENARRRWLDLARELEPAIVAEAARWGDRNEEGVTRTREGDWRPEIDRVADSFFEERTELLMQYYRGEQLLSPLPVPELSTHGGWVESGATVSLSPADAEIYVTLDGTDPRLPGGAVNEESARRYTGPIQLDGDCTLKARARDGAKWSALAEAEFQVLP